ncbi:MAG: 4-phosphoerythronate dehydrogenase PdxB [Candidatus Cyclobacteriaceae bacterium M3_2C_046]
MRIIADDKIPFLKGVLEPYAEIDYLPGGQITAMDVEKADALIIRTRTKCDAQLLNNSSVRFIATATIGFDHIDTAYCHQAGIQWTNAPGCNSGSVMQYMGAALCWLSDQHNFRLKDKTLGVIGVGNVGSKVARMAEILGMKVIKNDPPRARQEQWEEFQELDEVLTKAEIISLHVPLNFKGPYKTLHLVNDKFFENIWHDGFLINTSRGEVVDSHALKKSLDNNFITSAVLDVWEYEPDIDLELLNSVGLATPHIAGYSLDGKANGTAMSVQAVSKFFNLGLDTWFPQRLPEPEFPDLILDCADKTDEQVLKEAIIHTYNIEKDFNALLGQPDHFEKLRGDYPVRREFQAYNIVLEPYNQPLADKLTMLGFKVTN